MGKYVEKPTNLLPVIGHGLKSMSEKRRKPNVQRRHLVEYYNDFEECLSVLTAITDKGACVNPSSIENIIEGDGLDKKFAYLGFRSSDEEIEEVWIDRQKRDWEEKGEGKSEKRVGNSLEGKICEKMEEIIIESKKENTEGKIKNEIKEKDDEKEGRRIYEKTEEKVFQDSKEMKHEKLERRVYKEKEVGLKTTSDEKSKVLIEEQIQRKIEDSADVNFGKNRLNRIFEAKGYAGEILSVKIDEEVNAKLGEDVGCEVGKEIITGINYKPREETVAKIEKTVATDIYINNESKIKSEDKTLCDNKIKNLEKIEEKMINKSLVRGPKYIVRSKEFQAEEKFENKTKDVVHKKLDESIRRRIAERRKERNDVILEKLKIETEEKMSAKNEKNYEEGETDNMVVNISKRQTDEKISSKDEGKIISRIELERKSEKISENGSSIEIKNEIPERIKTTNSEVIKNIRRPDDVIKSSVDEKIKNKTDDIRSKIYETINETAKVISKSSDVKTKNFESKKGVDAAKIKLDEIKKQVDMTRSKIIEVEKQVEAGELADEAKIKFKDINKRDGETRRKCFETKRKTDEIIIETDEANSVIFEIEDGNDKEIKSRLDAEIEKKADKKIYSSFDEKIKTTIETKSKSENETIKINLPELTTITITDENKTISSGIIENRFDYTISITKENKAEHKTTSLINPHLAIEKEGVREMHDDDIFNEIFLEVKSHSLPDVLKMECHEVGCPLYFGRKIEIYQVCQHGENKDADVAVRRKSAFTAGYTPVEYRSLIER